MSKETDAAFPNDFVQAQKIPGETSRAQFLWQAGYGRALDHLASEQAAVVEMCARACEHDLKIHPQTHCAAHTNGIESVWAVLKRGLHGVYHHASVKHLGRYVDEFAFRLNEGNVERHTWERLESFVNAVAGKRITYKELIA